MATWVPMLDRFISDRTPTGHNQELSSENALFCCLLDLGLTGAATVATFFT